MISDNYQDDTAAMLHELGYEANFMENISGGEEIVIMEKDFTGDETRDVILFYSVVNGTVRKTPYDPRDGGGCLVRFIGRNQAGHTKPMAFGGSWGIYVKR